MKTLSANLIEAIKSEMKGKRLEKFLGSVRILNESAENGAWIQGGSRRANSGFYQGSGISVSRDRYYADGVFAYAQALCFGGSYEERSNGKKGMSLPSFIESLTKEELKKFSRDYALAWLQLAKEAYELINELDVARPKPVITKIGLSPKVTKTLQECNLDLDLSTIAYPEMETFTMEVLVTVKNKKTGEFENKWVEQEFQRPIWPKGTVHHSSRFAVGSMHCEACGKKIPSGRFVPFYAFDKKSHKNVSMWVGCDCAKNIFGIKDIGVDRVENLKTKGK